MILHNKHPPTNCWASLFLCNKTLDGWENGSVIIPHWSLTFDFSFIFCYQGGCQQPFSGEHDYFCVDYCVAGNSLCYHREDGWGQERPCASRGILNSICQLLPPQCCTDAPGAATFSVAFLSEGEGTSRRASTLLNVNVRDFDEFTGILCQAKTLTVFDSDVESRSDLWPAGKVEGKQNDSKASPWLNPHKLLYNYILSKTLYLSLTFFSTTCYDFTYNIIMINMLLLHNKDVKIITLNYYSPHSLWRGWPICSGAD